MFLKVGELGDDVFAIGSDGESGEANVEELECFGWEILKCGYDWGVVFAMFLYETRYGDVYGGVGLMCMWSSMCRFIY